MGYITDYFRTDFQAYMEVEPTLEINIVPCKRAKIDGPPEDCYPAEPLSVEITAVKLFGMDILSKLTDEEKRHLQAMADDYAEEYVSHILE